MPHRETENEEPNARRQGCNLPDDLLYDVPNNLWYRAEGDGTFTVGMTMIATGMAGALVAFTAKKVGQDHRGRQVLRHGGKRQMGRPGEDRLRCRDRRASTTI